MAENLTLSDSYTAKDLAAVRAYVQRVALAVIPRTYYDGDEDNFAATPIGDGPAPSHDARWSRQGGD